MKLPKIFFRKLIIGAVLLAIATGMTAFIKESLDTQDPESALPIITVLYGDEELVPDKEVRRAGFCAEETGKAWRALCLTRAFEALGPCLAVVGDAGWHELLPAGADIRPPVDYYGSLPGLSAGAACCLNCTSPLLPHGLTQRHFDVWAWGGVLLTDATPGLALFPEELTRPVTFRAPDELPGLFQRISADGELRRQLRQAWREHVRSGHTYARRLFRVLESIDLAG